MLVARVVCLDKVVSGCMRSSRALVGCQHAVAMSALLPSLGSGVRQWHSWEGKELRRRFQSPLSSRRVITPQPALYSSSVVKQDLPSLPVPPLEETLAKYLESVRPLVTGEELATTTRLVGEFQAPGGIGERLQEYLLQRASSKENWMSDWWLDSAYLKFRLPVVVWSSPGLVFPLVEFSTPQQQLAYAARVIAGALDYKRLIDSGELPADRAGGAELDMSQYKKIFATCRVPGLTKDSLVYHGHDPQPPTHIIVMHNNHMFKLEVYGKGRRPLTVAQLEAQLGEVVGRSSRPAAPLGLLTTQHRNVWGQAYRLLSKDPGNAAHLQEIQRALFVLCLDGVVPPSTGCRHTDAALMCLHGGGAGANSPNRWFDKTVQFVVGASGRVGLTYEHSPAEGPPIANLMDHIVEFMSSTDAGAGLAAVQLSRPQRLQFTLSPQLDEELGRAAAALDSLVGDVDMSCWVSTTCGTSPIKACGLSPDSFIQTAIQLAFYRIHGEPAAHYESASTRKFLHGRTETIRSCTYPGLLFCEAMASSGASVPASVRREALVRAVQAHNAYARQAVEGRGVDRHLLGLKLAAGELGLDVPPLFLDVGFIRSGHMRLSTSQVPARCEAFMCYGPLVPDGYGCCYNPRPDSIVFGVSALNSSPETDSRVFRDALETALRDMRELLSARPVGA